MTERTVASSWHGGYHCTVRAGEFELEVDEPASVGGTDRGPQPTDLLLASVASCFTLALSHSAKRRSLELSALEVSVTGVYEGLRFSEIRISARLGVDPGEVDALVRAAERVCYVTNTLRRDVDLRVEAVSASAG